VQLEKIKVMKILIGSFLILSTTIASCQIRWDKATDWTIYRYQGHRLFKISLDSLTGYDSKSLNQDSVADYLDSVQIMASEGQITWMGGYIATCKLDGNIRKVELSNYGGFFFDEKTRKFYQISPDKSEAWTFYLQQCYLDLTRKHAQTN
jgi:hypothetical protein